MDTREVGTYFKERVKIKKLMEQMLKPDVHWTRRKKQEFETAWKNYWKAYDRHEELCRNKRG